MARVLLLLLALCVVVPAAATELLERRLTVDEGLPVHWVSALAQGEDGTLWLGGPGGLVRWDGTQAVAFGTGTIGHHVRRILVGADRVVVIESHDVGWELIDGEVHPLMGPDGTRLRLRDAWVDAEDGLIVTADDRLWRRAPDGAWSVALEGALAAEVQRIDGGPGDSLLLGGRRGWWTWVPGEAPVHLADGTGAIQGHVDEDGTVYLMDARPVRVRRLRDGRWEEIWRDSEPWNYGFTVRDGTLWTGHAGRVWAVHPDGTTEVFGQEGAWMDATGPWLTDADGGVWSGGYRGAVQLPEPDLRIWGDPDGLPTETVRSLVVRDDEVVVGTWLGYAALPRDGGGPVRLPTDLLGKGLVCLDGDGTAWARAETDDGGDRYVAMGADGTTRVHPAPAGTHFLYGCAPASDGGVWFLAGGRLSRTRGMQAVPVDVGSTLVPRGRNHRVLEDRRGRLWVSGDRTVCVAPVAEVLADAADWTCHDLPAPVHLDDLHETEAGHLWVAERTGGVYRLAEGGFEVVPGAAELPTRNLKGLAASPRGGTWVLGAMAPLRVRDRPGTPAGWEVVERLPDWMGTVFSAVKDVVELPDGTLWLATHAGVVRIPPSARDGTPEPPQARFAEVRVDGDRVEGGVLEVPSGGRIALRLSAGTLRHPQQVRFRHRIDGGPWSAASPIPALELAGLGPGRHRVEVVASFDQRAWSARPATLALTVWAPWWQRPWVWVVGLLALGATALGLQQGRAALRLREERLRTRVAMDLHDEVGAGLASIGLLAGLAREPEVDPAQARGLVGRIADDAEDLGASVSGIVWSLRPGHATATALADFVAARARALLPHLGAAGDLHVHRGDDLDGLGELDLDVLRAVQLVALEALHNAARHAAATEVRVHLGRHGRRLRLAIEDDGVGFDPDAVTTDPDRGLGLRSMTERMRAVGGTCTIGPRDEGGTAVVVEVPPRRRRWWPGR